MLVIRASSAALGAFVAIALAASVARAQAPNEADVAFKKGRDLLKAGKYVEACAEFEKSEHLDPQLGTRFNIAQCTEKQGKLAAALELYRQLIATDTNATRKQVETDAAAELDKHVPHVQITVEPPAAGLVVKVGTQTVTCTNGACEARIDAGSYPATASAPGFKDATATVDAKDGATATVKLALVPATAVPAPSEPVATEPTKSHRKLYAKVAIGGGGAVLATGVVFGILARGNWNDAKAACGGSTACPDAASLAKANALRDSASTKATLSTAFIIAGAAIAGAGIVLYVTAPSSESAVTVAPTGTGISLSGRF
jgi:hypothetical protein